MKRTYIVIILMVAVLFIGGSLVYTNKSSEQSSNILSTTEPTITTPEQPRASSQPESTTKKYITLAEYDSNQKGYENVKKVYFFHASWCPICRSIDEAITSNTNAIPDGVTIIKTDFDSSIDLRKKYGVTYQYTFVQIDNNGNETAQWTAATLEKALSGIKS